MSHLIGKKGARIVYGLWTLAIIVYATLRRLVYKGPIDEFDVFVYSTFIAYFIGNYLGTLSGFDWGKRDGIEIGSVESKLTHLEREIDLLESEEFYLMELAGIDSRWEKDLSLCRSRQTKLESEKSDLQLKLDELR